MNSDKFLALVSSPLLWLGMAFSNLINAAQRQDVLGMVLAVLFGGLSYYFWNRSYNDSNPIPRRYR